ncbi:MAG: CDP-alcohol phosphatidyltransferase family protein, partial [Clostridia bacterium]|nr:CDP-alcohol phosphatidyltransferase family protein [Clostridia bacterium]
MKELFNNWKTVPNLLCLIRILLVPVFVVLYLKGYPELAVCTLIVSGLTDSFDGRIARRFNQISELGKLLDPVA